MVVGIKWLVECGRSGCLWHGVGGSNTELEEEVAVNDSGEAVLQ